MSPGPAGLGRHCEWGRDAEAHREPREVRTGEFGPDGGIPGSRKQTSASIARRRKKQGRSETNGCSTAAIVRRLSGRADRCSLGIGSGTPPERRAHFGRRHGDRFSRRLQRQGRRSHAAPGSPGSRGHFIYGRAFALGRVLANALRAVDGTLQLAFPVETRHRR